MPKNKLKIKAKANLNKTSPYYHFLIQILTYGNLRPWAGAGTSFIQDWI